MRIVRAQLEGVDAEPGRIAAADVARIILGLERAIARAAYLALGRARRGATGRHSHAVEGAATIDTAVRERMRWLGEERPTSREDALVGVLFEADFEGNKAKLRLPDGGVVVVSFSSDLADDIHEALRSRTRLRGLVRYHPRTTQASGVELRSIDRSTQLTLNADAFWQSPTFAGLQEEQRITGRVDPGDLKVSDLSDDERAAFLAALAE